MSPAAPATEAGIGHNNPPPDTANRLIEDYTALENETKGLLEEARALPGTIEDELDHEKLVKLVKDLRLKGSRAEEYRTAEKAPHLTAGRIIDGFFNDITDRLKKTKAILEKRSADFLDRKAAAERKKREEAAAAQRAEAERLAEEARKAEEANKPKEADKALRKAVVAEQDANIRQEQTASLTTTDLSRTYSAAGTASVSSKWELEILNVDDIPFDKIKPYFTAAEIEKAARAYMKAKAPACDDKAPEELAILPGVRIFKSRKANIR